MAEPEKIDAGVSSDRQEDGGLLPLIEEQLDVTTRIRETGILRLKKSTQERTETIEVPLTAVGWRVERVPVDRVVAEAPAVRQEGETTIYPVMEERLVVTRQLVVREEVRVTRVVAVDTKSTTHTVRFETLEEQRM